VNRRRGRLAAAGTDPPARIVGQVDDADMRMEVEPARGGCPWRLGRSRGVNVDRPNLVSKLLRSQTPMETLATPTARTAKRTAPRKQAPKSASRVKSTIVMSSSVDFRLGAIAASLRMDRSALAAKLGYRPDGAADNSVIQPVKVRPC
jgi:hypothetical protein